jgi:hypothetical protein
MDFFGTYVYPAVLLLFGGLAGETGGRLWQRYRHIRAETILDGLKELATQYECAGWIQSGADRVAKREEVFAGHRGGGPSSFHYRYRCKTLARGIVALPFWAI